ncbi:acetoin utilization protein AcuC [Ornithinibacillus sp. BX22]|uniref:Acetoin utilization protein AcuC n=2 Tax=Ornithinibacillus TaxID=484508 RepID=A0A923RK72_9BACI|nr:MULTISPECIES: acetoin utilization protein AcuC [Ornithinibacillus]MBC5638629.1 acetoin utilization protein AcuC [Ornithinibacillus hominis]MBS3681998.1 acetoin utilization protein AcuC [Ornithinibacillus massiliensis]
MNPNIKFVFDYSLLNYHFHDEHPFNQKRVVLTKDLLEKSGQLSDIHIIKPREAEDDEILLLHEPAYIRAVKSAMTLSKDDLNRFGLGTEDTPVFPNMHKAATQIVGATLTAVDAVLKDGATRAVNFAGGLHHGFKRRASGFCIYNDAAIAIQYIRQHFHLKVLYIDTDAHHGDGVQEAFYDDPNVCTFSIHETGRYLFPGTGKVTERGIKEGHGYSFNLPIDAFTQDKSYIESYETAIWEIAEFFKPDIIITQNGADSHFYDPLTHLCGSMTTFEKIPEVALQISNTYCNGRWIALGGGGYDIWRVVPRAWAQIWNVMKDEKPLQGLLPPSWIQEWQTESPVTLPTTWHDKTEEIPTIPRKKEIEEKNKSNLDYLLKYTKVKRG